MFHLYWHWCSCQASNLSQRHHSYFPMAHRHS
jgi:hypothetical protein